MVVVPVDLFDVGPYCTVTAVQTDIRVISPDFSRRTVLVRMFEEVDGTPLVLYILLNDVVFIVRKSHPV